MASLKNPSTFLSRNTDANGVMRYRVINHGVPISADKDTAEAALATAKQFRMNISSLLYDGDSDTWVARPEVST